MKIFKSIEWDMGHRIPNHQSQCKNLHGHRYRLEVCLEGKLINRKNNSSEDMVMDFGVIKTVLKSEVTEVCDHAFMFCKEDKIMTDFFKRNPAMKQVEVPFMPTVERIAEWFFNSLRLKFKDEFGTGLKLAEVTVWETPSSRASYAGK